MKLRYYTDSELEKLKSNIFVIDILHKRRIEYDNIFKLWCVMMRYKMPELTCKQIYERAGFDVSILSDSLPHRRIGEWVKAYEKFGVNYFIPDEVPYYSLEKASDIKPADKFKLQLLRIVLKELQEMDKKYGR